MGSALKVLMVEDSEEDAGLILYRLKDDGYNVNHLRVQTAEDFKQALQSEDWDIILSDFAMPGFNGMEAFTILQSSGLDLPFIMVSGTVGEDIAVQAMRHGIQDYLMKGQLARLSVAVEREIREAQSRLEKKQLQSSLQAKERRYQSIFNSANVSLWEVDLSSVKTWLEDNNIQTVDALRSHLNDSFNSTDTQFSETAKQAIILDVNQTALATFDLQESQRESQSLGSINDCWPQTFHSAWNAILEGIVKGQKSLETEGTITSKSGAKRYFLISLEIPQHEDAFKHIVISCYDTTQKHQMETQISANQRMEAIGQLAGGVAHDFNNLLTVILNATNLIQTADTNEISSQKLELTEIQKAAERASQLTRQLLAFSRKQVLKLAVISLNDSINDIVSMLQKLIGANIKINTDFSSDAGHINADPTQLEQIVLNLALNARDSMPEGGELSLTTKNITIETPTITKDGLIPPGNYAMFMAKDTGSGMPPEILAHLFEPFFTTKEQGKGTGLGLATVYGNVQQNKGYIQVESQLGKGSCFKVYFPCIPEKNSNEPRDSLPLTAGGIETILIVEDEQMVRNITCRILQNQGYEIILASNGIEALEQAKSYDGKIDLLLTDMIMPEMGGKKLSQIFSQKYPDTKVLFMSGYTPDDIGDTPFTEKPFTQDELILMVRKVLDTRIKLS